MSVSAQNLPAPRREPGDTSLWQPLRRPVFRLLWLVWLFSNIGTWMHDATASWLMTTLTTTPLLVALVQSATTAPIFLLALPSGALADIIDRRRYLIVTQFWMAAAAVVGSITLAGYIDAPLLLAVTFVLGIGNAMRFPILPALLPEVVPRAELPQALALNSIAMNASRAIGPAVAGLGISWLGSGYVFLLNALLATAVGAALLRWRRESKPSTLPSERFLGAMSVGVRFTRQSPAMQAVLGRGATFFMCGVAPIALLPLVAKQHLAGGPLVFSLLLSCLGIGAVLGAFLVRRLRRWLSRDGVVVGSTLVHAGMTLLIALVRDLYLAAAAMLVIGIAWMGVIVVLQVATQFALPDWVRARGIALFQASIMGGMTAGSILWGSVTTWYGLDIGLLAAAASAVLAAVVVRRFSLSAIPDEDFTPTQHWAEPNVAVPIEHDEGPVLVTIEYRLDPADARRFAEIMQESKRLRLRNGAISWSLFRDTADPGRYIEYFLDESWVAHLRQHERASASDRELERRKRAFHIGTRPPVISHYVAEDAPPE